MKKIKNFLLSSVMAIALVFSGLTLTGCSDDPEEETKEEYGAEAIVISSYDELKTFLNNYAASEYVDTVFSGSGTASNGEEYYVVLDADIDCGGEVLTPLLTYDYYGLTFTFDGNGHTISNFTLNDSSVRYVAPATGTNYYAAFGTLALFPISQGGEIKDITFKDVTYTLSADYLNSESYIASYGLKIGIVGYSRSDGSTSGDDIHYPSSYSNITIDGMTVTMASTSETVIPTTTEFPFCIGALIGIDADTDQYGSILSSTTSSLATRDNITVKNFTVNVDIAKGAIYVGGIVGHSNWERVSYTNCTVSNFVANVENDGNDYTESTYVTYNSYIGEAVLGSTVAVGGIVGGSNKTEFDITISNCTVSATYNISAGTNLVQTANYIGLLICLPASSSNLNVLSVETNNTASCSLYLNGASESTAVTADVNSYTVNG